VTKVRCLHPLMMEMPLVDIPLACEHLQPGPVLVSLVTPHFEACRGSLPTCTCLLTAPVNSTPPLGT
jgi:hypothetical protein